MKILLSDRRSFRACFVPVPRSIHLHRASAANPALLLRFNLEQKLLVEESRLLGRLRNNQKAQIYSRVRSTGMLTEAKVVRWNGSALFTMLQRMF